MVTAEAAVVLPVLVLVGLLAASGVEVGAAQTRCLQAAAVAARLTARGEPAAVVRAAVRTTAPSGADIAIGNDVGTVRVTVSARVRVPLVGVALPPFVVSESAVAAAEPDA
jgi:hypothetical protein